MYEIKVGDVFETKEGEKVRIIATDRQVGVDNRPIVGLCLSTRTDTEMPICYTREGKYCNHGDPHFRDLVLPYHLYKDWEIDDAIWVWNCDTDYATPRHFAGVCEETGEPLAFEAGCTSHTAGLRIAKIAWKFASKSRPPSC